MASNENKHTDSEQNAKDEEQNPYESMVKSFTNRGKNKRKVKLIENQLIQLAFGDSDSEDDEDFKIDSDNQLNSDESDDGGAEESEEASDNNEEQSSDSDEEVKKSMKLGDILAAVRMQTQQRDSPISVDGEVVSVVSTDQTIAIDQAVMTLKKPLLVCGICLESEDSETDEILECDNCGITVHEGCYGDIDESENDNKSNSDGPTEPWFCEPCKAGLTESPICELCPNIGGIYKQTDTGKWVHLICALYTPYIGFRDVSKLQTVVLEDIKASMWENKECMFCVDDNFARTGVCINCDAGMCKTIFHVTCAQRNGFLSDIPNKDDNISREDCVDLLYAHCKLHSVKLEVRKRKTSWLAFQSHVSKFRMTDDELERERIQNALRHAKSQYLEYRRYIIPSKQPSQQLSRLLSSCPEACMMLAKKAEILGLLKHPGYNVNAAITSGRILKHEPNLSVEFINHFFKREMQVKDIEWKLKNSQPTLLNLQKEQKLLTQTSETLQEKFNKVQEDKNRLMSSCRNLYNSLCKLAGKQLKMPTILRPKYSKEVKEKLEESTKLLSTIVNKCATCHSTNDQHLLTECATCKNYYHLACVDPPLARMPKKSDNFIWQCTECDSSDESESGIETESTDGDNKRRMKRTKKEPAKFTPELPKESMKRKSSSHVENSRSKKKKLSAKQKSSKTAKQECDKTNNTSKMADINSENPKAEAKKCTLKQKKEGPAPETFDNCCVCKKGGDKKSLVKCDDCKMFYHFNTCLDPPYSKSPKGKFWSWICEDCDESEEEDITLDENNESK